MPSNALHAAFRDASARAEQLRLIEAQPELLEEEDDSWEKWLPLHNAARWGADGACVRAALAAYPEAAKLASKGGYEALHLASMGGNVDAVRAIIEVYPEGALKKDNNGRTPLDEAREGSSPAHEAIVEAILALPGVAEAELAEQQLRAARAQELMRPEYANDECEGDISEVGELGRSVVAGCGISAMAVDEDEASGEEAEDESSLSAGVAAGARSLAYRMVRAASNALWRSDSAEASQSSRAEIAAFFTERAKFIPLRLELNERRSARPSASSLRRARSPVPAPARPIWRTLDLAHARPFRRASPDEPTACHRTAGPLPLLCRRFAASFDCGGRAPGAQVPEVAGGRAARVRVHGQGRGPRPGQERGQAQAGDHARATFDPLRAAPRV